MYVVYSHVRSETPIEMGTARKVKDLIRLLRWCEDNRVDGEKFMVKWRVETRVSKRSLKPGFVA